MAPPAADRLDHRCLALGLAPSRERARALILAGQVLVDGQTVRKAGARVPPGAEVTLRAPDHPYVSRGGLKLEAALDAFSGVAVRDRSCLDVGASTGGFAHCLLMRGARHVLCVDVGYGQLAWALRQDPRITPLERQNARHLTAARARQALEGTGAWPPNLGVVDVSFISLRLVLPPMARILGPERDVVALVKPQFEAGPGRVGKGGVVRDPVARQEAIDAVLGWARSAGWQVRGQIDSPVPGPKGNIEALAHLVTPGPTTGNSG